MPGAPKGNKNALKHGFYSRRLSRDDKNQISLVDTTDLSGEIFMLRIIADRLFEQIKDFADYGEEELKTINTLTQVTTAISTTARTQKIMGGLLPDTEEDFIAALNKVRETKKL